MDLSTITGLTRDERGALALVLKRAEISKNEAAVRLGFTYQKANRIFEGLLHKGLVLAAREGASDGGRRPTLFSLAPELPLYMIGINISQMHLDTSIVRFSGEIVAEDSTPISPSISPEQAILLICRSISRNLSGCQLPLSAVIAGGVSFYCAIAPATGCIIDSVSNSFTDPSWIGFPAAAILEERYGIRFTTETRANSACIGEYLFGKARDKEKVCVIMSGHTSVCSSYVINGHIVRSANNLDNAIGHMVVKSGGELCSCGNRGCIDAYSTGTAILRRYRASCPDSDHLTGDSDLSLSRILAAAEEGDPLSARIVTEAAVTLGTGITNLVNILDTETVICCGRLLESSPLYRDTLFQTVREKASFLQHAGALSFTMHSDMGKSSNGVAALALYRLLLGQFTP